MDRRFISRLNDDNIDILLPGFYFERNNEYGGFENKTLKLVEFTRDYKILATDIEVKEEFERSPFRDIFQLENER